MLDEFVRREDTGAVVSDDSQVFARINFFIAKTIGDVRCFEIAAANRLVDIHITIDKVFYARHLLVREPID